MIGPGAYFRDENIWRGRMLACVCNVKAALFELGFWGAALYLALVMTPYWEGAPLSVGLLMGIRMLIGCLQEVRGQKHISKDVQRYLDEIYPA